MPMDAHDLYLELWRHIIITGQFERVHEDLKACSTDIEIIRCVRLELDKTIMANWLKFKYDGKDESKAKVCRKLGNEHFHPNEKRYIKAIELYNESIALAEAGSEALAVAYANRSAVCYELKEYKACLQNISLAMDNPYPQNLLPKLDKRKTECLKLIDEEMKLNDDIDNKRELKLSFKPNPKIPHISDCLELKEDEQFGRYVQTNRSLSAGDIVIMEKPFSLQLSVELRYLNCDFCHQDKFLTLIPCRHCSVTMFCSDSCYQQALESYHRVECSVIKDMQLLFTKVILMALRTTSVAISTFNYNLEDLRQHIESIDESSLNSFKMDWTTINPRDVYSTIHLLATNQKLRSPSDLYQRAIFAIVMSDLLFERSHLKDLCGGNEAHRDLIRTLIFRHSQTSPVNMHSLMYMDYCPAEEEQFQQRNLGCGSFPTLSMINHSCAPNLVRMTLPNGCVVALINRPIKKGGQLFDNYGYHHCLETLAERQSGLSSQYCFKCQCEACRNNYPLYPMLPHVKIPAGMKNPIDYDELELLKQHDAKTARDKMPEYCRFLNSFDSHYPNYEVSSVQEAILRCSQILFAFQSRKIKYKNLCTL